MNPPVRVVCGSCLRSVEIGSREEAEAIAGGLCPFCGERVDSDAGLTTSRTRIAERAVIDGRAPDSRPSSWAGMWSRGSLGSLGRFQLRERLGDGGFGEVYLAYDPRLDRDVAVKVLKQTNPSDRVMERFFREARAAARLDHPNIVAVHDAGFDDGRCWVSFHLVTGRPLNWYRDHHQLDPPTAARILRELADAVDHAHHQGVIHRDLKPANVLIDDHGRPRLIDFGLSRRSDVDSSLTRDGAIVGTPAYMSPEQALGLSRNVDERSDVFSLGVMFFEVLCGQRPYPASGHGSFSDLAAPGKSSKSKKSRPPSVRALNPNVPAELDRICMRAIAQDPGDRYPSARALADDLDGWLISNRGKTRRRRLLPSARLVLGLVAGIILGAMGHAAATKGPQKPATPPAGSKPAATPPAQAKTPPAGKDATAAPARLVSQPPAKPKPTGPAKPKALTTNARFVGSVHAGKFHLPTCGSVGQIAAGNLIEIHTPEEAEENNLKPCGICKPLAAPRAKTP